MFLITTIKCPIILFITITITITIHHHHHHNNLHTQQLLHCAALHLLQSELFSESDTEQTANTEEIPLLFSRSGMTVSLWFYRALDDIKESIKELEYYRRTIFNWAECKKASETTPTQFSVLLCCISTLHKYSWVNFPVPWEPEVF